LSAWRHDGRALLVNGEGESVAGEGPVDQAAFAIHAAIHEARPDVIATR
jgi:ribulose-5-phosphate 4-epimerase/fuculose-1-phosphate aldolase